MFTTESFEIDQISTLLSKSIKLQIYIHIYSKFFLNIIKSFIVPNQNVATISNNATVIEGVSRCRNQLLNGDTKNYDWDNGYTCHELGSSSIVVQLPQPYLIDSMRFYYFYY